MSASWICNAERISQHSFDAYHPSLNVTISAKTRIICTIMYIGKKRKLKLSLKLHSLLENLQGLMGPAISKGSFKSTNAIYYLTRLAMESSEIFVSFL